MESICLYRNSTFTQTSILKYNSVQRKPNATCELFRSSIFYCFALYY